MAGKVGWLRNLLGSLLKLLRVLFAGCMIDLSDRSSPRGRLDFSQKRELEMTALDLEALAVETPAETAPVDETVAPAAVDAEGNEVAADAVDADDIADDEDETEEDGAKSKRGQLISEARRAKLDKLFAGKQYEIIKSVDLTGSVDAEGKPRKFETPLGNKGKKGYAIKLVEGQEPEPGWPAKMIFGASVLREAQRTYGAITMPEEVVSTRTRRTKEQKQADEAAKQRMRLEAMEALAAELDF